MQTPTVSSPTTPSAPALAPVTGTSAQAGSTRRAPAWPGIHLELALTPVEDAEAPAITP